MKKNRPKELELYAIKETGDILQYIGDTCTDYHKGSYDPEYKVFRAVTLNINDTYCGYELYDKKTRKYYELERLPENMVKLLYARK